MKSILFLAAAGLAVYLIANRDTVEDKRKWLRNYFIQISPNFRLADVISVFSDADIDLLYRVVHDYIIKVQPVPQADASALDALQAKYSFSFS